jgi:hypothetical protein
MDPPRGVGRRRRRIAWLGVAVWLCLAFLVLLNFIAGVIPQTQSALGAAVAECEGRGWQADDLGFSRSETHDSFFFGKSAAITLRAKDPNHPATIHIDVSRPMNLMAWRVTGYREDP